MTGVMATLGYLNEKNRFVAEPATANSNDRIHIRGVLMETVVLSVAGTEARTSGYGELSGGSSVVGMYSCSKSDALPVCVLVLVLEESVLCSAIAGLTAKEALASMPIPTSLAPEEDLRRVHSELRRC